MTRTVIIGGGFGGLACAKALAGARGIDVVLVDRENHHLFQPLLYQVATAGLSPGDIAVPVRGVLRGARNVRVIMGEVVRGDLERRQVFLEDGTALPYDHLVVAAGARTNWYGHDDWSRYAYGMKSLRDAIRVRERVLMAFEAAEREPDAARREELLTFVVIGAGPTGVELAGAISELSRHTLRKDFRIVDPTHIRVILIEMADRVLTPFDPDLSAKARAQLEDLRVEVRTGAKVTDVTPDGVIVDGQLVHASMVCWASGVSAVPLAERLGAETHRGSIVVDTTCRAKGRADVFAIGDCAWHVPDGADRPLPGLCPVALQQGRYVGKAIRALVAGRPIEPFRYWDKGIMATVGRSRAIVQAGRMRMAGYVAWLAWLFVHILYLIEFRNRVLVLLNWFWQYVSFKRGARLIALPHGAPRAETKELHARDASIVPAPRERPPPG